VVWFAAGVLLAGFMAASAYFTNSYYGAAHGESDKIWEWPFVRGNPTSKKYWRLGKIWNWAAVIIGFTSLGPFIAGLFFAAKALIHLT
jgi:hypothetical protein